MNAGQPRLPWIYRIVIGLISASIFCIPAYTKYKTLSRQVTKYKQGLCGFVSAGISTRTGENSFEKIYCAIADIRVNTGKREPFASKVELGCFGDNKNFAHQTIANYSRRSPLQCWYDPDDLSAVTLKDVTSGIPLGDLIFLVIAPFFLGLMLFLIAIVALSADSGSYSE